MRGKYLNYGDSDVSVLDYEPQTKDGATTQVEPQGDEMDNFDERLPDDPF